MALTGVVLVGAGLVSLYPGRLAEGFASLGAGLGLLGSATQPGLLFTDVRQAFRAGQPPTRTASWLQLSAGLCFLVAAGFGLAILGAA